MIGAVLLMVSLGAEPIRVDECTLEDERCARHAREFWESWSRCAAPRIVVDQSASTSSKQRFQGVWCEWNGSGSGNFHSAPVAWEWLAGTGGRGKKHAPWSSTVKRSKGKVPEPTQEHRSSLVGLEWSLDRGGLMDEGPLASLVARVLRAPGSRFADSPIYVIGNTLFVIEVHPGLADLRREDLPWGLLPWRPMWFHMPVLRGDDRKVLESATIIHIVRTDQPMYCLINEISGARLLTEGPAQQDATATAAECKDLLERLEPVLEAKRTGWFKPLRHLLGDTQFEPAFERTRTPNVDRFPGAN